MHAVTGKLCELTGERVTLTPFAESDITEEYVSWLRDPEVVRFSNQRFRQHDPSTCLKYLHSFDGTENLFLAIRMRESGKTIGTITAYVSPPHGTADLGILLGDRAYWGRGLGLDAWTTLMAFLFEKRGLRKVTGGTLRCNAATIKIMERSGMHLEAVRARQEIVEGEAQDILYFAKFRDD